MDCVSFRRYAYRRSWQNILMWLAFLACLLLAAFGVAGCVWAIKHGSEFIAVGLGGLALVSFVAAWLTVLSWAFEEGEGVVDPTRTQRRRAPVVSS